jgi:4-amino-4-deoxy-L-arabinose transferase-like glycosyltransferase
LSPDDAIAERTLPRALLAAVAALTVLTRLPGLAAGRAFSPDEATLAVGGRAIAHGATLYVNVIDRKPPLPFAAYALVQRLTGTTDLRPIRLLVAVLIVATALVVASEAQRRWGRTAAWVAALAVVLTASALGPADAQAANFELFALFPIAVAVVAAARGRALIAGVALAVAVLCKQPAAVTAIPVAWSLWRAGRWRLLGLGAAAGGVATLVLAAPFGLSRVAEWALFGTGGYLSVDPADLGVAAVRLLALVGLTGAFWCGPWLLVIAPRAPGEADGPSTNEGMAAWWLLLGVSALAVLPGFRFFPHYLLQLVPAVALLAAAGSTRRPRRVRPAALLGAAAAVVALALAATQAIEPAPKVQRDLAAYVRRTTEPGDRILVWGNVPEVYWRSGRRPAGGYTHTEFVTGYSGGRRHQVATEATVPEVDLYRRFVARLRREQPVLVLDTAAAGERGGKDFPIANFPAVTALLRARYERVATVDHVPVYRLRSAR